MVFTIRQTDLF